MEANRRLHFPTLHIFTDGSHTSTASGAAFVILDGHMYTVWWFHLVCPTISFDVEVIAMQQTTSTVSLGRQTFLRRQYLLGSRSLLLALNNQFNKSATVNLLKKTISLL